MQSKNFRQGSLDWLVSSAYEKYGEKFANDFFVQVNALQTEGNLINGIKYFRDIALTLDTSCGLASTKKFCIRLRESSMTVSDLRQYYFKPVSILEPIDTEGVTKFKEARI